MGGGFLYSDPDLVVSHDFIESMTLPFSLFWIRFSLSLPSFRDCRWLNVLSWPSNLCKFVDSV